MRTRFQQQMEELREKLLRMGGMAELAVGPRLSGLYGTGSAPLPACPRK